ncbi:MAG: ribonuclease P protein component [Litoreibacter sp.]|nr:ribonuclease P protein component [Litoreibacter sp.]
MSGRNVPGAETPPAVSVCPIVIETLKKRADFLRAAKAKRAGQPGFMLQARSRDDGDALVRVGFTCSKKVGNAVARNRAKRRLRALAHIILPQAAKPGFDYVLIGRAVETGSRDFKSMQEELRHALKKVHS